MRVLGVRIDSVDMNEAVEIALNMDGGAIFTPNAVMLERARKSPDLKKILNESNLNLPDSAGAVLAVRILYGRKIEKVSGVDFGIELARACAASGRSIFLLGGEEGVADTAGARLTERINGLKIAGTANGFSELDGAAERIKESGADFVFVCLGSPMQENWITENMQRLRECVFIGLGGSLDVYAGRVHRAPRLISRIGLEWAWRMLLQPRRLKNLSYLIRFFLSVFVERHSKKAKRARKNRKIKQN